MRLEADLGVNMLDRSGKGVTLTAAGEAFRRQVEKPVATLEAAALQLRQRADRHRIRLSVVTSLGNLWLLPRLENFHTRHPDIEVEFRQYQRDDDFLREDVDLWIALKRKPRQQWPRQVAAEYLTGRDIVAVCTPALAASIRTPQALLAQPLLYHSLYTDNWALWAAAVDAELPTQGRRIGFDLVLNLIEAARSGMGVAVVQRCMVESDLAAGRLAMPVPGTASTGRGYYLCRKRSQSAHPATEVFASWIKGQAEHSNRLPASP
jgi:DNA-binding transcriptional LysR family regulator